MSGLTAKRKYKKLIGIFGGIAILLILFWGVNHFNHKTVHISNSLVQYEIDELWEKSTLVATGIVTDVSDAFQIQNASGAVKNFTDYEITITNSLRGSSDTDIITVRVEGGTVDGYTVICDTSPTLTTGNEYLLFLYQPKMGGDFNTLGDYYYVRGHIQGVFSESNNNDYISQAGETLSIESLISPYTDEPIDPDYARNAFISRMNEKLQNGDISQDEYNYWINSIDEYATIVE